MSDKITIEDIQAAVTAVTAAGPSRYAVGVEYHESPEDEAPWIVRIGYRMASSRKGYHSSLEGYGATPQEAAADAVDAYRRAVADGRIAEG